MHLEDMPWYLTNLDLVIRGFEGEGEDGGDDHSGEDNSGNDNDGSDAGGESAEGSTEGAEDVTGLKRALQAERRANKTNAKRLKELEAAQQALTDKEKNDLQKAQEAEQRSAKRVESLAGALRKQAIDVLIEREARAMRFIDVDDALVQVARGDIEVEQDDDNPADIKVDAKSVKAAVKALAERKKHLVGSAGGDGEPSGSAFGGAGSKKKATTEDELKKKYPALQ